MTLREVSFADVANEMVYEGAIGAVGAYLFARNSVTAVRDPALLISTFAAVNMFQPMLCYSTQGGFDGMLKRRVNYIGPAITTVAFGAMMYYMLGPLHNITLSDK